MITDSKAFEQLPAKDQQCVIDVVAAMSVLIVRIPTINQPIYDYVCKELISCYDLPAIVTKHALHDVGRALFDTDWDFTVTKRGKVLSTDFGVDQENDGQTPI